MRGRDLAMAGIVFASRLPFITRGPGVDPDAWRMIDTGRAWVGGGGYEPSRLPGYPLMEGFLGLTTSSGFAIAHLVVALASALVVWLLLDLYRRQGIAGGEALALAVGLHPVFFTASIELMDYSLSLAGLVGSLALAVRGRSLMGGLVLGLAAGLRFSTVAFLPALLVATPRARGWTVVGVVVGASVALLPTMTGGGLAVFTDLVRGGPTWGLWFLGRGIADGITYLVTLPVLLALTVWMIRGPRSGPPDGLVWGSRLGIVICLVLFATHPMEVEYLLPLLLWFPLSVPALWTPRRSAILLGLVLLSHVVVLAPRPGEPLKIERGYAWTRMAEADQMDAHVTELVAAGREPGHLTVSGPLYPMLEAQAGALGLEDANLGSVPALRDRESGSYHVYLVRPALLDSLRRGGYTLVSSEYAVPLSHRHAKLDLYRAGPMIRRR